MTSLDGTTRSWRRWLVPGVIGLNLALALSYVALLFILARQDLFWRADFTMFYTGWSIVRDGRGAELYDFNLQTRYQQQILAGRSFKDGLLPFNYPPYVAVVPAVLAWLPRSTAFAVWALGQLALLVVLLRLLWQMTRAWKPYERRLLLTAVVGFPPLFSTFALGSLSLFLLVCLLQVCHRLKTGDELRAGCWLALGTVKPQLIVMQVLLVVAARRWRVLGGALLLGILLIMLSSGVLGWRIWLGFVEVLRATGRVFDTYGIVPTAMYNLKGTLALMLGNSRGSLINLVSLVAFAGMAIVTILIWRGPWRIEAPAFELRMALTILLGLLFSPHLNPQDGLVLVAPALLFYSYRRECNLPREAYAAFVLVCPILFLVGEFLIGDRLGIRLPVVAMLVLLVWMARALEAERRGYTGSAADTGRTSDSTA